MPRACFDMTRLGLISLIALVGVQRACAFSASTPRSTSSGPVDSETLAVSRRESVSKLAKVVGGIVGAAATAASAGLPLPANALPSEETARVTTRMGGLLERYQDQRGWVILSPSGWNKFEGEVGAYDVKWQDLVDPKENIKVSSTPVKSTTTSM